MTACNLTLHAAISGEVIKALRAGMPIKHVIDTIIHQADTLRASMPDSCKTNPAYAELLKRIERGTTTAADATALREWCFAMAHQIADTACFVDAINTMQTVQPRDIVRSHVDALHDIAEQLAGNRVNEIYAAEEAAA